DNTYEDGDGISPVSANGVSGYFDQPTISIQLILSTTADDATQLNYLSDAHIPVEVFAVTNAVMTRIAASQIWATYDHKLLIDAHPNLAAYSIAITINLADIVSRDRYQGGVTLFFKLIDGVGNLSLTTNTPLRLTVDLSAPTGQMRVLSGVTFQGSTSNFAQYGVSTNMLFTSVNAVAMDHQYSDAHSGLAISWNKVTVIRYPLEGGVGTAVNRDWSDVSQVSINSVQAMISNNLFLVESDILNGVGEVAHSATWNVVFDTVPPTINAEDFMLTFNVLSGGYAPSSVNYLQSTTLDLVWVATDNVFASSPNLFAVLSHRGVYQYRLSFSKDGQTFTSVSANMMPAVNNHLYISPNELLGTIGEGRVYFKLEAVDFAGNWSSRNIGPYFMDLQNTLNEQIVRIEPVTANNDSMPDYFQKSPFDASGKNGYFDRVSVDFIIHLSPNASDLTQLSYLEGSYIPLEVYVVTDGVKKARVWDSDIHATYNRDVLPSLNATSNLASVPIAVTINFSNYVGTSNYNGRIQFYYKIIDGAGKVSATTNTDMEFLDVTVDMTAPVGNSRFGEGFTFVGSGNTFGLNGVSDDVAFARQLSNLVISMDYQDAESGLAISSNYFSVWEYSLTHNYVTSGNRGWTNVPTLNLSDMGTITQNRW
ncbi:MAG: hypothetical protein AABZ14_04240, partial [Candidatus Margulisiibacteriota bacterium]